MVANELRAALLERQAGLTELLLVDTPADRDVLLARQAELLARLAAGDDDGALAVYRADVESTIGHAAGIASHLAAERRAAADRADQAADVAAVSSPVRTPASVRRSLAARLPRFALVAGTWARTSV